jgi:MFS transporter, MHS family, alpha-ketoglutarate permease
MLLTLTRHPKAVAQLVAFTLLSTLSFYAFLSAPTPFAVKTRHAEASDVFLTISIATVVFIALQYLMSLLADRYGLPGVGVGRRPRHRAGTAHLNLS